jgi:hypothetical protein
LERSADLKENRLPAYLILTREKTRDESQLNEYRQLVPASLQKHPANFAPSMVATKSWKVPQSKKSSSSNSPASKTPAHGSTAPNI